MMGRGLYFWEGGRAKTKGGPKLFSLFFFWKILAAKIFFLGPKGGPGPLCPPPRTDPV